MWTHVRICVRVDAAGAAGVDRAAVASAAGMIANLIIRAQGK